MLRLSALLLTRSKKISGRLKQSSGHWKTPCSDRTKTSMPWSNMNVGMLSSISCNLSQHTSREHSNIDTFQIHTVLGGGVGIESQWFFIVLIMLWMKILLYVVGMVCPFSRSSDHGFQPKADPFFKTWRKIVATKPPSRGEVRESPQMLWIQT